MSAIGTLLQPSNLAMWLLVAGITLRFWPRLRAWSTRLVALAAAVLLVFSLGIVAQGLLRPLEQRYPPWTPEAGPALAIDDIVVLTGWSGDDVRLPPSLRLNDTSASRVLLTAALWRRHHHARVLVSGEARVVADMVATLQSLGVDAGKLESEGQSRNTAESAANCASRLRGRRFALVTSAGHLPRAMGTFQDLGLQPAPIPADYRLPGREGPRSWLPSPRALAASDLAVHEYLGALWYRFRGRAQDPPAAK
jgi:uncharacterized SAM-binding protein YcdF (DUF218 family)